MESLKKHKGIEEFLFKENLPVRFANLERELEAMDTRKKKSADVIW